jgi:hypothetical protein
MAAAAPADPAAVTADLGDQSDPEGLVAALEARAPAPAPDRVGGAADESVTTAPAAAGATGADRARCRDEAERAGAGRLGSLLSTSTVRWRGQPAEVLVFALAQPEDDVSRQALVLARPGCAVLADPRF